jgi:hypothetical protein
LVTILGERALVCPFCESQFTDGEALSGKQTGCFLATLLFLFPTEIHRVFLNAVILAHHLSMIRFLADLG